MADSNNQNNNASPTSARRPSLTSQALADMFGTNRARPSFGGGGGDPSNAQTSGTGSHPGSLTAAAQASRRRMSLTALGINGGANNQTSPLNFKRSESISSYNSNSIDESAVEDGDPLSQNSPTTPFARRMSFGARALRDVRTGTAGIGGQTGRSSIADPGGSPGISAELKRTTPPTNKARENGYNWAESFRSRAERSSSIVSSGGSPNVAHQRAKSVAAMQPPPVQPQPAKPMVPDHMQERILKGDFYMD